MTCTYSNQINDKLISKQIGGNHYNNDDIVIQPIVYCELNKMPPLESKVIKYTTRHPFKNGAVDIDKAIHCLELIKDLRYGDKTIVKETMRKIEEFMNSEKEEK